MIRQLVLLLAVLCAACVSTGQQSGDVREKVVTWRAVAFASAAVDLATTFAGQRSGARERNALLGQQPVRIAAISTVILGVVWWLSRDLPVEQQTRIWKWVAAAHLGAAVWNGGQLRR